MDLTVGDILLGIWLLGLGGILGTYVNKFRDGRNDLRIRMQEFKEMRYNYVILMMYAALDFEKNINGLKEYGRDFTSFEELIDELKAEWHSMLLFASDDVLREIQVFIKDVNRDNFYRASAAMRNDFREDKVSFKIEDITVQ